VTADLHMNCALHNIAGEWWTVTETCLACILHTRSLPHSVSMRIITFITGHVRPTEALTNY